MNPQRAKGSALALVLLVMAIVGALVAATFIPALEEVRAGRNSISLVKATLAAESGLDETLAYWGDRGYDTLPVGDSVLLSGAALVSRSGWFTGALLRQGPRFFTLRAEGYSRDSAARQARGLIVQRAPFDLPLLQDLAAQGQVVTGPIARLVFDSVAGRARRLSRPNLFQMDGDVSLGSGLREGVLVVRGALEVGLGAEFRGVIVVDGPFRLRGGKVVGAVAIAGPNEVNQEYGVITYSSDAIAMGYDVLAEAVPIRVRAEFFAH